MWGGKIRGGGFYLEVVSVAVLMSATSSDSLASQAARRSPARFIQGAKRRHRERRSPAAFAHVSKRRRIKWKRPCLCDFWEINLRHARARHPSSLSSILPSGNEAMVSFAKLLSPSSKPTVVFCCGARVPRLRLSLPGCS